MCINRYTYVCVCVCTPLSTELYCIFNCIAYYLDANCTVVPVKTREVCIKSMTGDTVMYANLDGQPCKPQGEAELEGEAQVKAQVTIESIKRQIQDHRGIPVAEQRLFIPGRELKDVHTFATAGVISEGCTITLALR